MSVSAQNAEKPHLPVLIEEVCAALAPLECKRVLDGTFGAGGYSRAFLEAGAEVTALDRDPNVAPYVSTLAQEFEGRFIFHASNFSQMAELDLPELDAIVLDIGVSSMQLDDGARGFSFMREGPLDMRMGETGVSARDIVNEFSAADIAAILFVFGEERQSRRIANAIVAQRDISEIETTTDLAQLIEKTIGRKPGASHPATRSFQALRIAVNAEFDELVEALFAAERMLAEGGQLLVVTFHSLEDRIVKKFFAEAGSGAAASRHMPMAQAETKRWRDVAKAVKPSADEIERNPRARSALLRFATRTREAAREVSFDGLGVPRAKLEGAL